MWKRFLFFAFGSLPFRTVSIAYTSKPFRYRYFAAYCFGFKVFNQIGTRRYFQLVENIKCFAQENAKEVVEGLGTGSFVTVTNVTPHSCSYEENSSGKIFSNNLQGLTPRVSKEKKLLLSLSILANIMQWRFLL